MHTNHTHGTAPRSPVSRAWPRVEAGAKRSPHLCHLKLARTPPHRPPNHTQPSLPAERDTSPVYVLNKPVSPPCFLVYSKIRACPLTLSWRLLITSRMLNETSQDFVCQSIRVLFILFPRTPHYLHCQFLGARRHLSCHRYTASIYLVLIRKPLLWSICWVNESIFCSALTWCVGWAAVLLDHKVFFSFLFIVLGTLNRRSVLLTECC